MALRCCLLSGSQGRAYIEEGIRRLVRDIWLVRPEQWSAGKKVRRAECWCLDQMNKRMRHAPPPHGRFSRDHCKRTLRFLAEKKKENVDYSIDRVNLIGLENPPRASSPQQIPYMLPFFFSRAPPRPVCGGGPSRRLSLCIYSTV